MCAIPYSAAAYVINVTVVPYGHLDYITLWPDGQPQPYVATLNSWDGRIKATAAIVAAGTNGAFNVYTTNATDLVIDISGYFVGPRNRNSLYYYPLLRPCEVINTVNPPTRDGLGGPALFDGIARTFQVSDNPNCTIPRQAKAYVLNVTAMPIGGAPLDYLTVWPSDQAQPYTSVLNSSTGTEVANAAIVASRTGAVSMFVSGNDANVQVVLNGYFGPAHMSGDAGAALYTFAPCRGFDTRPNMFTSRLDFVFQAQGGCVNTLPPLRSTPYIDAMVMNATVVPDSSLGFLSIWPYGYRMPTWSTLMATDGAVTSNMAIVPMGRNHEISAMAGSPTNLVYDLIGYFASPKLTMLTQMPMPDGTEHVPYGPVTMLARGGVPPYTWSADLPGNLAIDAETGVVSGCPVVSPGDMGMMAMVTDSAHSSTTPHMGTITIHALPALTIATGSLPSGTLHVPYAYNLAATGGYGAYTWTLVSGHLPPGFILSSNGLISGYDAGTRGNYHFTVQVADEQCNPHTPPVQALSIRIN